MRPVDQPPHRVPEDFCLPAPPSRFTPIGIDSHTLSSHREN